jgi:predicted nucleic acid-binding protein
VYLDATIPSYYYEKRGDPILQAHHLITVDWWNTQRSFYDLVVSEFVLAELQEGDYPFKNEVQDLIRSAAPRVLPLTKAVEVIADTFIENYLMPRRETEDAYHLAFAAYHKIDYLLTWNCRHLANANKQQHIAVVLTRLRLFVPSIVTPEMLFQESDPSEQTPDH